MDGAELLQRVRETYAGFETYSDVGTVESPGLPGPGLEFQTQFKRPLKFRFHWLSWHPHFGKSQPPDEETVCTEGTKFRSKYRNEISTCEDFPVLLAGATGISRSSVHKIVNLLVPRVLELDYNWHDMSQVKILDDEPVGEAVCLHLVGTNANVDDTDVWIEKNSYLVKRIKETTVIGQQKALAMLADVQTDDSLKIMREALSKMGQSAEMLEKSIAALSTSFVPTTYQNIYNYSSIAINQPIDETIFCELS